MKNYIEYLTGRYDYITKMAAVEIGVRIFRLTIADAVKGYNAIEKFSE